MKQAFHESLLPADATLISCSSHEERCLGIIGACRDWAPRKSVVLGYEDHDRRGEKHHAVMLSAFRRNCSAEELPVTCIEGRVGPTDRFFEILSERRDRPLVVDMSVLSKGHLLRLLRCIDDWGMWGQLWAVYSEPEDYEIAGRLPLSFGLSAVTLLPGFNPSTNPSRPLHAAIFLGYEGDRAFSTYDILQPQKTTLVVPHPPFQESWVGRTEELNRKLLAALDQRSVKQADALDPSSSETLLKQIFGETQSYSEFVRTVCPLGTKPQALGAYMYVRECIDPPSVIYSKVLRHNHDFYSRGIGQRWLVKRPE